MLLPILTALMGRGDTGKGTLVSGSLSGGLRVCANRLARAISLVISHLMRTVLLAITRFHPSLVFLSVYISSQHEEGGTKKAVWWVGVEKETKETTTTTKISKISPF